MLLNVGAQGANLLKDAYLSGKIVQHYVDSVIDEEHTSKPWDGYIHPSHLDWSKAPEKQFEKHVNKGWKAAIEAKRRFALGDLIHEYVQSQLEKSYGGYREVRVSCDKSMFHGTCDFVGLHDRLGTTVFEIKSYSPTERDTTWANNMREKFERLLSSAGFERERKKGENLTSRYHVFTDKQIEELYHRLNTREKVLDKPSEDHLTQGFTYAWQLTRNKGGLVQRFSKSGKAVKDSDGNNVWDFIELPPIERVCICYVNKATLETVEFWYNLNKKKGSKLYTKAKENYLEVYKELKKFRKNGKGCHYE